MEKSLVVILIHLFNTLSAWASEPAFEKQIQATILMTLPAVVSVTGIHQNGDTRGSGFIVDKKNRWVITNFHVVAERKQVNVKFYKNEKPHTANVLATDAKKDLALLEVKEPLPVNTSALSLAERNSVATGNFVLAFGSPGGFDFTSSLGIISATERQLSDAPASERYLQTDAPIFHGSSGGPLVALNGEVVGVNSRGGADGAVAFAIPSETVKTFLKEAPKKQPAYLDVTFQELTPLLREHLSYSDEAGVLISYVQPDSAAQKSGLRSGDILVRSETEEEFYAASPADIQVNYQMIRGMELGKKKFKIWRNKSLTEISVELSDHPKCDYQITDLSKIALSVYTESGCVPAIKKPFLKLSSIRNYFRKKTTPTAGLYAEEGDILIGTEKNSA